MSLNSVVNNLVRAAAGIPTNISDGDLDKHVAELLAKEAKERDAKWSEIGLGSLLGNDKSQPDPNAPKPNKRFLASIIKTVDNHNSTVIRQQLEAAETARSNSGLGESSKSAASRMFGGALRDASKSARSVKGRGMWSDDLDRGRGDREERERERRWHDKRQGSRERRTRYDVGEEEEMFNSGSQNLAESKKRQDWMKRKSIKDDERRREREREEEEDDYERRKRRKDLYGDGDDDGGSRGGRRYEEVDTRSSRRRDRSRDASGDEERSSRRNERKREDGQHEGENRRDRRRRRREEAERENVDDEADQKSDTATGRNDESSRRYDSRSPKRKYATDNHGTHGLTGRDNNIEDERGSRRDRRNDLEMPLSRKSHKSDVEIDDEVRRSSKKSRRGDDDQVESHEERRSRRTTKTDDDHDEEKEPRSSRRRRQSRSPSRERDRDHQRRRDHEESESGPRSSKNRSQEQKNESRGVGPPTRSVKSITPPPPPRRRAKSPTPGPPPPPPNAAPPPPDTPPPSPPPVTSKMDKYFDADYDPRLDLGEVPRNGYVPEVGWDNMLAILKERGKKPRNRSPGLYDDPIEIPKIRLRRTPSPTLQEIEKAEKRAKRAQRGFDDDFETEAERSKRKADRRKEKDERARVIQLGPGDGGGLFDVTYVKKGGTREWDVGK